MLSELNVLFLFSSSQTFSCWTEIWLQGFEIHVFITNISKYGGCEMIPCSPPPTLPHLPLLFSYTPQVIFKWGV